MRRWVSLLTALTIFTALFFNIAVLTAAGKEVKPGKERWPIKTSLPDKPAKRAVALADLLKLADPPNVAKNDSRYQSNRIPSFANSVGAKEGDIVTTAGWLYLVAGETDGDYHIQVSDSSTSGNNCIVVEVPRGEPEFVPSAELRPKFEQVRTFIREKLLRGKEPSSGGSVMSHPVYVKITGQLFYDDAHVGDPPRGKKGMHAATLWELHPVTGIEFAPPPGK